MSPESAAAFAVNDYAYTQSDTAADTVTRLSGQGHRAFELMVYPGHLWPAEMDTASRAELRRHVESAACRIVTLNMPNVDVNVAAASPGMRRYSLDLLCDIVRLAAELGARGVVVGPGKPNPLFPMPVEAMTGHFFTALDELLPLARASGVELWLENMPFAFLPLADQMMSALERYGAEEIGVVYDVANAVFAREDPGTGLRRVRERLRLVHLSDTPLEVYRHDPIGGGAVDFAALPPLLDEVGYDELPVLELITPDPDREIPQSVDRLVALGWPTGAGAR